MKRISRDNTVFYMDGNNKPALTVESGETVIFETIDCFSEQIKSEDTLLKSVKDELLNPVTGPLYIDGAEEGDMLKIKIIDIKTDNWGVMVTKPGEDVLKDFIKEDRVKIFPIKDGEAIFNDEMRFPINPMIGVIGVAPKEGSSRTTIPDLHGGNMDCKRIVKNAVLYLPVFVKGGLLSMGDLHAIMADGEAGGCGLETGGEVTIKVEVIKGKNYPLPMVLVGESLMTVASCETLYEAARQATINMHEFLVKEGNIDEQEAAMIISLAGELKICQIVDPLMTCRMELPISILDKSLASNL